MATSVYADWMARGRTHQWEGRPADAISCFRRAAREAPYAADPRFHLGEVLWQLGLPDEAIGAWREAGRVDSNFLAARLALAEALFTRGDWAGANEAATGALAAAPTEPRALAAKLAAMAATGDLAALKELANLVNNASSLASAHVSAAPLAFALEAAQAGAERAALLDALIPHAGQLPPSLLATLAENGRVTASALRNRKWLQADAEALRRIAVALFEHDPEAAVIASDAYGTLCVEARPQVPLLWPQRTSGSSLRVVCVVAEAMTASFAHSIASVKRAFAELSPQEFACDFLCLGDAAATRASLAGSTLADALFWTSAEHPGSSVARAIAAADPDVLVDTAGLAGVTGSLLAARPARNIWSLASAVSPMARAPLVDRTLGDSHELASALRTARSAIWMSADAAATARELAEMWDSAVRAHQRGERAAAAAGYARVLEAQPAFAPALHLAGVLAREQGDDRSALRSFTAALAAAPDSSDARTMAVQSAIAQHEGGTAVALAREGLERNPSDVELWRALGHAELARGNGVAAAEAFGDALLLTPVDGETHYNRGVALQMAGNSGEAARAYQRALTFRPDLVAADFNLGVLFQLQGQNAAAAAAYNQVLAAHKDHVAAYKNLGEVLFASGRFDSWVENFKRFEVHCPNALPLVAQALEVYQYLGDFAKIEEYLEGLRNQRFPASNDVELVDALEELLFLLLNFDVEPEMLLRFGETYDEAAKHVYGSPLPRRDTRRPGKLRIGYLSADLRNHVMGKMMWQAIELHDRDKFELYFFSTSPVRDAWTEKFVRIAKRFATVATMHELAAAAEIARDDLDLLVDLSTHTQGARPGILAQKPARVQMTHVASCGAVSLSAIDFKLTDRFADVPENQAFHLETLLPMEGCVYPFRRIAPAAVDTVQRARLKIKPETIVIGAFARLQKLSRRCLTLWRDVLQRIPHAMLAFSPTHGGLHPYYARVAAAAGIAPARLLFLPQGRDEAENQSRYEIVDFALDTMPYGGVNGTLEALAMGVPVVTLKGRKHGERGGYSILANFGVPQTVAESGREYIDIAFRLATDAAFMREVRAAIQAGLEHSTLVDRAAHTRHLEAAYVAALSLRAPEALTDAVRR
ncbi:MAG: tetratricopeptide repeat protein [Casimicrobiaceae bacterium]